LNEDSLLKLSSREYKEAYDLLRISKEISHETGFFANAPFINCRNGVVDVMSGEILPHSPDFLFRQTINANYAPDSRCDKFLEYVDFITGNNEELKRLLRVIIGYICSHYTNAKTAVLIYGIPHTGKSVLCNAISRIIGKEYVAHVDLSMLHKQEYAASLSGKLLNIAPDLRNEPIKEVGFFKSLVSHDDTISTRPLYGNPRPLKCETKMIFSSNHLLEMDSKMGIYDVEAVFNRLLYLPYQNLPITSEQDNKHLSYDIYLEKDGVFTWAVKGLREYIELGENFPRSSLSDEIKAKNVAMYCPEKIFFSECLKVEEGRHESSAAIKAAFEAYCLEVGAKNRGNISNYLEEHEKLKKAKKRVDSKGYTKSDGNPIHVYENVHIKKKYRYLLGEDKKESFDDKE
jgi:putative DNA primase/helicase